MKHIVEIVIPALFVLFTLGAIIHTILKDRRHRALMAARRRADTNYNELFREAYADQIATLAARPNPFVTNLNDIYGQIYQDGAGNLFTGGLRHPDRDQMARVFQDALVFGTGIAELKIGPRRRTPKKRNLPDWW